MNYFYPVFTVQEFADYACTDFRICAIIRSAGPYAATTVNLFNLYDP